MSTRNSVNARKLATAAEAIRSVLDTGAIKKVLSEAEKSVLENAHRILVCGTDYDIEEYSVVLLPTTEPET